MSVKKEISLLADELADMVVSETKSFFNARKPDIQPLPNVLKENVKAAVHDFFLEYYLSVVKRSSTRDIYPDRW